jgi:hypothetical protein
MPKSCGTPRAITGNELRATLYHEAKVFGVAKPPMRYKLSKFDVDWRGQGKTLSQALEEAFKQTGAKRSEFKITKSAKNDLGKTVPVEWRHPSGAEVNIDWSHLKNGPDAPHVGWQTGGKDNTVGHIILDYVFANR